MLLELAIGDAYGAGFEYADVGMIRACNDLSRYVKHPRHDIKPGHYTDDTQMSLAIAEALVSGEEWTPLFLATKFVEVFKRDPRQGYAGSFYGFLREVKSGAQFLEDIIPSSDKSGAAMRAGPLGVLPSVEEVIQKCTVQAALTHNTPAGVDAANAAALMTHYFLYELGAKRDLGKFLNQHVYGNWTQRWQGKVGSKGWMSVKAAITAVVQNNKMSDLLIACIDYTGDVDTVATIALAAGSCSSEIEQDLPSELIWTLENYPYGRDYLQELDKRLLALVEEEL